jgi:hypothetical protein
MTNPVPGRFAAAGSAIPVILSRVTNCGRPTAPGESEKSSRCRKFDWSI